MNARKCASMAHLVKVINTKGRARETKDGRKRSCEGGKSGIRAMDIATLRKYVRNGASLARIRDCQATDAIACPFSQTRT